MPPATQTTKVIAPIKDCREKHYIHECKADPYRQSVDAGGDRQHEKPFPLRFAPCLVISPRLGRAALYDD
jgi:hypothetical protein